MLPSSWYANHLSWPKRESNPPCASSSGRGGGPKAEHLLTSKAELERETGKDPWVDLEDVYLCFIGAFFPSKRAVKSACVTASTVWQCTHGTGAITGQVALAMRVAVPSPRLGIKS